MRNISYTKYQLLKILLKEFLYWFYLFIYIIIIYTSFRKCICWHQLVVKIPLRMAKKALFHFFKDSHFSNFPNVFSLQVFGSRFMVYLPSSHRIQILCALLMINSVDICVNVMLHVKWQEFHYNLAWGEALIKGYTYKWVEGKHFAVR